MSTRHTLWISSLTLACLALLTASAPAQDSDFWRRIDEAVERGVEFLKGKQLKDGPDAGSFGIATGQTYSGGSDPHPRKIGNTAWALYALLKSEVPPDDPVITLGFKFIHDNRNLKMSSYERAAVLLAIDAKYEGMLKVQLKAMDPRLREKYRDKTIPPKGKDLKLAKSMAGALAQNQTRTGGWRYGIEGFSNVRGDNDNSATQLAVLGLKAATRMRVSVKSKVFWRAMDFTLSEQQKDGPAVQHRGEPDEGEEGTRTFMAREGDRARGWPYMKGSTEANETAITGSMTSAAVCTLLVIKSELRHNSKYRAQMAEKVDTAIFDGVAWLVTHYSVHNSPGGGVHLYYLYGLERVGVLGQIDMIGPHHWYTDGAQVLLQQQRQDGSWGGGGHTPIGVINTAYALLFLKKGSTPVGIELTR